MASRRSPRISRGPTTSEGERRQDSSSFPATTTIDSTRRATSRSPSDHVSSSSSYRANQSSAAAGGAEERGGEEDDRVSPCSSSSEGSGLLTPSAWPTTAVGPGGKNNLDGGEKALTGSEEDGDAAADDVHAPGVPAYNFSFAMGGWLMIYNFGVAKCLLDHGLHKVQPERQRVIGSSAGSLAAAALVLEADIDKACGIVI